MKVFIAPLFSAMIFSTHAVAAEKAVPIGIDLGTTTCAQINEAKAAEWSLSSSGVSVWSNGPMLQFANPNLPGLAQATNLLIICDEQGRSIHVSMTIPKDDVHEIAQGLDKKYKTVQKKLPRLGNGLAKWAASNASISIEYVHVSFSATLAYDTKEASKLWAAYVKAQSEKKHQETASQL